MDDNDIRAGAELGDAPVLQYKQFVGHLHNCWAVGNHHHDCSIVTGLFYRTHQRSFADRVEIGVRLIKHDQARAIVEASGKADTLPLAAGKGELPVPTGVS